MPVGVFPNSQALLRLAGAVLVEAHDEWQTGDRRYLAEGSMAALTPPPPDTTTELLAAGTRRCGCTTRPGK
jgi:putative transposase